MEFIYLTSIDFTWLSKFFTSLYTTYTVPPRRLSLLNDLMSRYQHKLNQIIFRLQVNAALGFLLRSGHLV